jgi:hypothetical protein
MSVWDTGAIAGRVSPAALAGKGDWIAIPSGKTADTFRGDAVLSNGRIVAVLRQRDTTLEIHALKPAEVVSRVRLRLLADSGEPVVRVQRLALVENGKASVCLEATFTTAKGAAVAGKFRLKRGEVTVQVEPGPGAGKLRVECPGRFAVLPDFFADDIAVDATRLPLDVIELPSENFVLHLTGAGDAIAMCVFDNRRQDVKVTLAGAGDQRMLTGSEIGFEGKKIWVALMETPAAGAEGNSGSTTPGRGIWHSLELKPSDTGKTVALDWRMPFAAQWRVDFTRGAGGAAGDLIDSWEMLLQDRDGVGYIKPSWLGSGDQRLSPNRHRWNTVLGSYPYPCWSDADGNGFLQPLRSRVLRFQGPALVYPIHRVKETPLDAFTVVDVMRNTLGVGPCEHILDLEGQKAEYRGRATCGVRDKLTPI